MNCLQDLFLCLFTNCAKFSLIDSRPVFRMGEVCEKHNVKLLTYGTLVRHHVLDRTFQARLTNHSVAVGLLIDGWGKKSLSFSTET